MKSSNAPNVRSHRRLTLTVALALLVCASMVAAQEIIPVRDLTGGTSVFVFKGRSNSVSKRFVSQGRSRRSSRQRAESARRVNRQYASLSKKAPRRQRTDAVDPNKVKIDLKVMPAKEASKLFAGVGEYYVDRNEYDSAIDFFRDAAELDKDNVVARQGLSEVLALKGNELLATGSREVAKRFFEEALTINPTNAPAYFGLAEILSEAGDEDAAVTNYEKALAADSELTEIYVPLGILYYQSGNNEKADELLSKAAGLDANDAQAQQFLGLVRMKQGRLEEAQAAFARAKTLDPQNSQAFYYSGETLTKLGKTSLAIDDFKKAIELDEKYFDAWFGLGTAHFELGNFSEAIKALEQAKRLQNDNPEVYANLADAYRQVEDPALAGNKYNLAESNYNLAALFLEQKPDFAENQEVRELTAEINSRKAFSIAKQCEINMAKSVRCKWDTAVQALQRALELSENSVDRTNLGWAYYNAGKADMIENRQAEGRAKLEKARETLADAVSKGNTDYRDGALLNLGMVYTDLGDTKGAIQTLKTLVDAEPNWTFAINELGIAYFNDQRFRDAAEQFKRALKADDKFAEAYYNLGRAEFKNNNLKEVKKAHDKLNSLGRKDLAVKLMQLTGGAIAS